jgi:hypothetical protein
MKDVFIRDFEQSVRKWFDEVAAKRGLRVEKVSDGVLQIRSPKFRLRVSGSRNHGTDLVDVGVTLFSDESQPGIGLANIMEFRGDRLVSPELRARSADIDAEVRRLSDLAEEYCGAFLAGQRDQWNDIVQFVEEKIAREGIHESKYSLPGFVRQEWEVETDED